MGNRLSKIYTRTGDEGTTGLADGSRVAKTSARVEAMGAIDELNCLVGAVLLHDVPALAGAILTDVQHALFDVGGELAIPGAQSVTAEDVAGLEAALDGFNDELAPLKEFILPGGGPAAVAAHQARAVCRRAERRLLAVAEAGEALNPESRRYLNRLSDLLFVLARVLAVGDRGEVYWRSRRLRAGEET